LNILWYDYMKERFEAHGFKNIERLEIPYERADFKNMPFSPQFMNSVKLVMRCQK
jgi:hypothetical protein